jgi:hypothetical protein
MLTPYSSANSETLTLSPALSFPSIELSQARILSLSFFMILLFFAEMVT